MGTEKYGRWYWCIKTDLSKDGEIYVMADETQVTSNGTLVMKRTDPPQPNLVIAAGHWTSFYAASVLDGSAVAVELWKGEIAPRHDPDED